MTQKTSKAEIFKRAIGQTTRALANEENVEVNFTANEPSVSGHNVNLPQPARVLSENEVAKIAYAAEDEVLSYVNKFVVPVLVSRSPKGLATIADNNTRSEVDRLVRNKKKAAFLKTDIPAGTPLDVIAAKYGSKVDNAPAFSGVAPFLGGNNEPKIAAIADILAVGAVSTPIASNEAVYVITVLNKQAAPPMPNPQMAATQSSERAAQVVLNLVIDAFKKNATIEDNRATIY